MKKVYISGRISDMEKDQYMTLFRIAEEMLNKDGFNAVNPTRFWLCRIYRMMEKVIGKETAYRVTLLYDVVKLLRCDLIYKIPGWKQSRGANIESCVAYHFKVWPMRKDIAKKIDKRLEKMIKKFESSKPSTINDAK